MEYSLLDVFLTTEQSTKNLNKGENPESAKSDALLNMETKSVTLAPVLIMKDYVLSMCCCEL